MREVHQPIHRQRVLHLVYREGLSPLFESMVVAPAAKMEQRGFDVRLAVFCPLGNYVRPSQRRRWRQVRRNVAQVFKGTLHRLPSPPARVLWAWDELKVLRRWFGRVYPDPSLPVIVHARNAKAASLAIELRRTHPNVRVLYDMRGVMHMETLYQKGYRQWEGVSPDLAEHARDVLEMENHAAQHADAIICVSHAMRQFACETYGVDCEKITVVWNHFDAARYDVATADRDALRRSLGISDRFAVVYCGSLESWQVPDQGLRIFSLIKRLEASAVYLAVTTEPARLLELASARGIPPTDVVALRAEHRDVPRYLAAGDLALVTRGLFEQPHVTNQVSSPVKFAEYLASGVPVVIGEVVSDYSAAVRERGLGVVVSPNASDEDVMAQLKAHLDSYRLSPQSLRSRCRQFALEKLASNRVLADLERVYFTLLRVRQVKPVSAAAMTREALS